MKQKYYDRAALISDIAWLLSQSEITTQEFIKTIALLLEKFDKEEKQ